MESPPTTNAIDLTKGIGEFEAALKQTSGDLDEKEKLSDENTKLFKPSNEVLRDLIERLCRCLGSTSTNLKDVSIDDIILLLSLSYESGRADLGPRRNFVRDVLDEIINDDDDEEVNMSFNLGRVRDSLSTRKLLKCNTRSFTIE